MMDVVDKMDDVDAIGSTPGRAPLWPCELIAAMAGEELLGLFVCTRVGRHFQFVELETWLAHRKGRAA